MTVLSPFVYWAQSETSVFIKVDLKDVKKPNISLEDKKLQFEAKGLGAKGLHNYEFSISFNSDINPEISNYKVYDNKVDFTLAKAEKGWWSRLTSQPQKPAWLKIDFDRWQSEENLSDDDSTRDVRNDYPDLYERLQKEEIGYKKEDIKKVYLVLYNLFMFVGFFYVCVVMSIRYLRDGVDSIPGTYDAVGGAMKFIQLLQFLEVMHSLFGYTKSSLLASFLQVGGRSLILFALIEAEPRLQTKPAVFYLFAVWSAIEIVRYPYYISQLYKKENGLLTWLRYTIWIPLYPMGFICEGVLVLRGILYFEETGKFTVAMPNILNFTFHFPTFLRVYSLIFAIPIMYTLVSQMYKARTKKLKSKRV